MPKYEIDFEAVEQLPPGERAMAKAKLGEFLAVQRRNPLEGYNPLWHQHLIHVAEQRLRAIFGGNRAGKTTVGVVDDLLEVTPRELVPAHLLPYKREDWRCPRYIRCMAPSNKLLHSVLIQKFRELTPKALLQAGQFGKSFNKQDNVLLFECGCRADFLSYEMALDKFGGAALHRCHYDEEPPEEIRQECYARLVDFRGLELFTMTPLQGMTWMYDDVWLKYEGNMEEEGESPKIYAITASMLENTYLDREAVDEAVDEWSDDPEMEAARIYGNFVHFGGMVYPHWQANVVDAPTTDYVHSCDVVVGIDPGVAGGACVWVAFDGRNDATVFAEVFTKDKDVADVCVRIDEVNKAWGLTTRAHQGAVDPVYVIDPSARARDITHAVTIESEFAAHNIFTAHGQADREAGCYNIRRRQNKDLIHYSRDLRRLPWEMKRYRVEPREDGKWDVVKKDDHACDAQRYAIQHRPWIPTEKDDEPDRTNPDVAQGPPKRVAVGVSPAGPME